MTDEQTVSYLNEAQKFGKASGKMEIENLEEAINSVNKILIPENAKILREADEKNLPGLKMAIYCHDCRSIVPPEIKQIRKKFRKICGKCGSVKISAGREEALRSFYHLEEKEKN